MRLSDLIIGHRGRAISAPLEATLSPGEFVCLVGRNGSGKTTLLRTLAGLIPPVGGSVTDNETPPAVVLTAWPDLRHTSVRQLVAYGRLPHGRLLGRLKPADRAAADDAIRRIGIEGLAERAFHSLSDGEKQKAMIALALAQDRQVLLLDEPAAFLDYPSRRDLMVRLRHLAHAEGKAVLLSTHDVELACAHADSLWLLCDGRLRTLPPADFHPRLL